MNKKIRGFEEVDGKFGKHGSITVLPTRGTAKSAGHDFRIKEDVVIKPGETKVVWSDVKAYMQDDEVLELYVRSSVGIKKNLALANGTGIIDSDYYSNPDNDGNIGIPLYNFGDKVVILEAGERVAQGIFKKYLTSDNCKADGDRNGGIGHTGEK